MAQPLGLQIAKKKQKIWKGESKVTIGMSMSMGGRKKIGCIIVGWSRVCLLLEMRKRTVVSHIKDMLWPWWMDRGIGEDQFLEMACFAIRRQKSNHTYTYLRNILCAEVWNFLQTIAGVGLSERLALLDGDKLELGLLVNIQPRVGVVFAVPSDINSTSKTGHIPA